MRCVFACILYMCMIGCQTQRSQISTINCVWTLLCTLHPDLTSHTWHTKFRSGEFLSALMLFVSHRLLFILFCSHLFVSLNSLYSDFSTNLPVNLAVVHRCNPLWCLQISIWFVSPVTTNICLWIVLLIFDSRSSVAVFGLNWTGILSVRMCVPIVWSSGIVCELI